MTLKKTESGSEHPKQDFQVERLAFFSDAVFAIAITLLIIEFKTPHVTSKSTTAEVWSQLQQLKYNFFSLILSFALISIYWRQHHFLFKHIRDYNKRVITANMLVLLPAIFFPFTTAFLAESFEAGGQVLFLSIQLFLINFISANLALCFLYWLCFIKFKFTFSTSKNDQTIFVAEILLPTASYIIILIASFIFTDLPIFKWIVVVSVLGQYVIAKAMLKSQSIVL